MARDLFRIDTSLSTDPVVVGAVFGIAIGFAVLIWPDLDPATVDADIAATADAGPSHRPIPPGG